MKKLLYLVFLLPLMLSCGVGDDDGERLGDYIVGTWLRGWEEGDVIIEGSPLNEEGDPIYTPSKFAYDKFIFKDDGEYNGMRRTGSFVTTSIDGDTIFAGNYRCDNNNLELNILNEGRSQKILSQVQSFSESIMTIRYHHDEYNITVILRLKKER